MAGAGRVRRSRRVREAPVLRAARAAGVAPEEWRDWARGLPDEVLEKVAGKVVAQTEAGWAAQRKEWGWTEERIQAEMARRKRWGNCLFVFARVCRGWRKAQLKVGDPLRTRVYMSDVLLPGSVALAKWALAEGCPMTGGYGYTMAAAAAELGHMELVRWLVQKQGFAMDRDVMKSAARGGNLELIRWLRGEGCDWNAEACEYAAEGGRLEVLQWLRANGCPWDAYTCDAAAQHGHLATLRWAHENGCDWDAEAETCGYAAEGGHLEILQWLRAEGCPWDHWTCSQALRQGHVEVLRWARENGCPMRAVDWDKAAAELGYTDNLGNLVDDWGDPVDEDEDWADS